MAVSTNGALSPSLQLDHDSPSFNVHAKRKRETSIASERANGITESSLHQGPKRISRDPQQQISDFVEVLRSHDTKPSLLNRELPPKDASTEPHAKRKKSEVVPEATTVISRAAAGKYSSLDEVLLDVKAAATAVSEDLRLHRGAAQTQYSSLPPETLEAASKVVSFRKKAEEILRMEKAFENPIPRDEMEEKKPDDPEGLANGSTSKPYSQLEAGHGENKLVLTLYANAPTPKQLFSSLQEPVKSRDGKTEDFQPLREAGLPYGITATQIVPVLSGGLANEKKRVPTLGDLFSTSSPTLPFPPPKPSRASTTRNQVVGWYLPSALETTKTQGNQSYYGQHIKSGQWLDYSGISTSLDAKRRHRERALSLSGLKTSSATDTAEQEAAKLEALFRSAYSGFAPSKDDAAAIVPEGMLNRLWWRRVGEKSFERIVRNASSAEQVVNLDPKAVSNGTSESAVEDIDLEDLEQAIQHWDESVIDPNLENSSQEVKSIEDKDVQEILEGVSELLETLNSYQRIRNMSLTPVGRPVVGSSNSETAGTPAKPSESETATYNTLRAQLSLMIAMLPPYAVSKLDSDQLAEVNISTKIQILAENHKGVMEEDEATARAKVAQMHAASTSRPAPISTHRSSASLYGNQYSSSPRPAVPSGQQYYGAQTPLRSPSGNLQRQPSTATMSYGGVRPASSAPYQSQSSYASPTYAHQLHRTSQSQYGSSTSQQYYQPTTSQTYGQAQARNYGATQTSASQVNARYQNSNQTAYQNNQARPQALPNVVANGGMDYRYSTNNSNASRQSPPKPQQAYSPQPQTSSVLNRSFGTPTPSIVPQARQYFPPQALTNGAGSTSPQPQTAQQSAQVAQAPLGATGYHTVMTAEQQATMMERQRAQLAQQQGTQHQARNAAQAGAMNASVPHVNGGAVTAGH